MTSGSAANQHGRTAENSIADLLRRQGCVFHRQSTVGLSIFGEPIRADFLVTNLVEFPRGLVIESKWQDVAGSADEKFPFIAMNIHECYQHPAIIVVSGGGCRPGALRWLHTQVDGRRLVAVLSHDQFMSWLQRHVHVQRARLW